MKRFGIILLGLILTLGGLALAGLGLLGAFGDGLTEERFLAGTAAIPFGVMLFEVGLATIWLTIRAMRGGPSRPVALPPWWASALIFGAAVGGGWLALRYDLWWLFFPLATVAVFAPIAAAGRLGLPSSAARPGWGRLLAAFCWGALVTPALAIAVQILAVIGAVGAAVFGVYLSGQGNLQLIIDTWTYYLQGRTLDDAQSVELLQFVLRQPLVLAVGGAILVLAAPISEELFKFVAAPLFGRTRTQPGGPPVDSTLTIFLIGLASGLGFAATENIFYVAQAGEQGWLTMALVRSATPIMHGAATAIFALGWARQFQRPQGRALLWGALGSFSLHGFWNLCAGLVLVAGLFATAQGAVPALAGLLLVIALGALGGLLILSIVVLLRQRRTLANEAIAARPTLEYRDGTTAQLPIPAYAPGGDVGAPPAWPLAATPGTHGEPIGTGPRRDA
jgi:hypothetical protein